MNRRILVHGRAKEDMRRYYRYLVSRAPATVERWFRRLQQAIHTLEQQAEVWALAPESKVLRRPIRLMPFGRYPNKFRVYYYVESDVVHVVRVIRGQRRSLRRDDLRDLD